MARNSAPEAGGLRGSTEAHSLNAARTEGLGLGHQTHLESGHGLHNFAPATTVADANTLTVPQMKELPKPGDPPPLRISGEVREGRGPSLEIPTLAGIGADTKKLNLDSSKSVADLTASGAFVDMTNKAGTVGADGREQSTDGKAPKVSVLMTDATGAAPKADFMIKADGTVAVLNNPEQSKNKEIVVAVERGAGQLMPNAQQQNSLNDLYTYLDGRIKSQFPDAQEKGVQLDDQQDLVPKTLEESLKVRTKPDNQPQSEIPDSARPQTEQMGRFKGSGGGKMSRQEADDYFPERTVPRGKGEDNKIAAMKDVVAGFNSKGAEKPYEHVVDRGSRGFGIGRYGLTYDQVGNWLSNLDIDGLEELERQGKVPKGTAAKMKRMKASMEKAKESGHDSDLDPFLQKLKAGDKNNPVTAQDINENFGKEVQELAGSYNVGKLSQELGSTTGKVDPGELALGMMLGRVPTAQDMQSDDNKRFVEAARQAYNIAEARYEQKGSNLEFGDVSNLTDAMKEAVGKQLWRSAASATEFGNLGCAISVTKILRAGGVPVREVLSVNETASEMRRIGAQQVSLNEAISSGQPYVVIKKQGGSHTGIGIGRTMVENSSGRRQVVQHDISQSSLRSGSYAFIVPTKYNNARTA